jgi:hypothetical protein
MSSVKMVLLKGGKRFDIRAFAGANVHKTLLAGQS